LSELDEVVERTVERKREVKKRVKGALCRLRSVLPLKSGKKKTRDGGFGASKFQGDKQENGETLLIDSGEKIGVRGKKKLRLQRKGNSGVQKATSKRKRKRKKKDEKYPRWQSSLGAGKGRSASPA